MPCPCPCFFRALTGIIIFVGEKRETGVRQLFLIPLIWPELMIASFATQRQSELKQNKKLNMKFKTLLCLCFRIWLLVKTLTGGQRLKHRWERLPKTHRFVWRPQEVVSRGCVGFENKHEFKWITVFLPWFVGLVQSLMVKLSHKPWLPYTVGGVQIPCRY